MARLTPAPAGLNAWTPNDSVRRLFAAGTVTWSPHTTPVAGPQWLDGRWTNSAGEVLACDLVTADDCCSTCLSEKQLAWALQFHAETGGYFVMNAYDADYPALVLPGGSAGVSVQHAVAALRYLAVEVIGTPPLQVFTTLPLATAADLAGIAPY